MLGKIVSSDNLYLKLFKNNIIIDNDVILSDLEEVTVGGYAPAVLFKDNWSVTQTADISMATYDIVQTFSLEESTRIYGYFITTIESTLKLLWVERFSDGPYTLSDDGGTVDVTPRLIIT